MASASQDSFLGSDGLRCGGNVKLLERLNLLILRREAAAVTDRRRFPKRISLPPMH
jgi:hypothetical protein